MIKYFKWLSSVLSFSFRSSHCGHVKLVRLPSLACQSCLGRNPKIRGSMAPSADSGEIFTLSCFLTTSKQPMDLGSPSQVVLSRSLNLEGLKSDQSQWELLPRRTVTLESRGTAVNSSGTVVASLIGQSVTYPWPTFYPHGSPWLLFSCKADSLIFLLIPWTTLYPANKNFSAYVSQGWSFEPRTLTHSSIQQSIY